MKELDYDLKFYQDKRKKWRWKLVSGSNGKIIVSSSQGYSKRKYCVENASFVLFTDWKVEK
jgi:uncharacterized protein YegP (UPF0339 family)